MLVLMRALVCVTVDTDEEHMDKQVKNVRLSDDEFFRIRKEEVLPQWETGRQIEDLDEVHSCR